MALTALVKRPLPPPPVKTEFLDARGMISPAWQIWFNEIFVRTGNKLALSNKQLETLLEELDTRVEVLEP